MAQIERCALTRKGYDVFGKAYGYMLRHDPHDIQSVEHRLMQQDGTWLLGEDE